MKRIIVTLTLEVPDPVYPGFAWDHLQKAVEEYAEAHGWKLCAGSARDWVEHGHERAGESNRPWEDREPATQQSLRVDREPSTYDEFLQMRHAGTLDPIYDEFANEMPSRAMWEANQRRRSDV